MKISSVTNFYPIKSQYLLNNNSTANSIAENNLQKTSYASIPLGHTYGAVIHFGSEEFMNPEEEVEIINFENYKRMPEVKKEHYRGIYKIFQTRNDINTLFDTKLPENKILPLQTREEMDNFLEVAKWYNQFKDNIIVCLGRSPKWFLNASLWMKDGIPDYRFTAFSGFWYRPDKREGMIRLDNLAPTEQEYEAYKTYLVENNADPKTLLRDAKKLGTKIIITDYIETGKGMTSYLDVMSRFAEEQGVLEEFVNNIEIAKIGSLEYTRHRLQRDDIPQEPEVILPERMQKYNKKAGVWDKYGVVKQHYFDMDYVVFQQMLYNQNSNECRSTYYPCRAWTKFNPKIYRTNRVKDLDAVASLLSHIKSNSTIFDFPQIMSDYRNLLNFRILDGLDRRGLLKDKHRTKE